MLLYSVKDFLYISTKAICGPLKYVETIFLFAGCFCFVVVVEAIEVSVLDGSFVLPAVSVVIAIGVFCEKNDLWNDDKRAEVEEPRRDS